PPRSRLAEPESRLWPARVRSPASGAEAGRIGVEECFWASSRRVASWCGPDAFWLCRFLATLRRAELCWGKPATRCCKARPNQDLGSSSTDLVVRHISARHVG